MSKTLPCWCCMRRILAQSIGVSVSATKPEITTAPATAMPNSLNNRPAVPVRNASGVNTATSAIVVAMTANPISFVPRTAASSGDSCSSSWCRNAFSSTMIASSTTMPIAIVSASSVKLLIEKPRKYMIANVAMIDAGIELDARDILQLHQLRALMRDDHLPELLRRFELAERPHREFAPRRLDPPGGDLDVARDDRAFHVLHGEPARRERLGVDPHPHRVAPLAENEIGRAHV